jgi:hypothetical protein
LAERRLRRAEFVTHAIGHLSETVFWAWSQSVVKSAIDDKETMPAT